jgi:2',3'-cyclic-nucleotide 2'-phosphodiesterase/3'-nucleotidase/5'-nucleotidase
MVGCQSSDIELTVIHTNDSNSHLANIARLATVINEIREEARSGGTLLLDAGDVCGGTVYYSLYKGVADIHFMEQLGYDAMCPGNHEFDHGAAVFSSFMDSVDFPVVCANADFSAEVLVDKKPLPWVIIEKNGERYGILGLLTQETLEIASPGENIVIDDPVAAAGEAVAQLQEQGITKIIALTHQGWQDDLELAAAVEGIDIIIGAHSATLPENYPAVISAHDAPTLVVHGGDYHEYLGRLDVVFDKSGVLKSWQGELVKIDDTIAEDAAIAAVLTVLQQPISEMMTDVVGQAAVFLDGENDSIRSGETNLGNLVADAVLAKAKPAGAEIAIVNSGGIRESIQAGDITREKLMRVLPFENYLILVDITGRQLIAALENGVSQAQELKGRFPQVAGFRFTWNSASEPGSRIVSVEIQAEGGYVPLDENAIYRIVINDYMYSGGDGYTVFGEGANSSNPSFTYFEIMLEYLKNNSPVGAQVESRITDLAD